MSEAKYDVIIVGGGLSGLSAAVSLAGRGARALVLEKNIHAGGRASSFYHPLSGELVDNGQHILMGCYEATREFLHQIGTHHLAALQPLLFLRYRSLSNCYELRCPSLPAPFHLVKGFMNFQPFTNRDRLKLLTVLPEVLLIPGSLQKDSLTVNEWLAKRNQSPAARKYLWDILCIGAMNNQPSAASALLFARVVKKIFTGSRENSSLLLPEAPLRELLVSPAQTFLEQRGGKLRTGTRVVKLIRKENSIQSVALANGEQVNAPNIILAVPWFAASALFEQQLPFHLPPFQSSPIVNVHLWFDRFVMEEEFTALVDSTVQWIFSVTHLQKKERTTQHLSCVISSADEIVHLSKQQILEIVMKDLSNIFPLVKNAKLTDSIVIKEKRATFLPEPGIDAQRPGAQTELKNLFLAGDWTNTHYPATIESAILSGKIAASLCR
ncbi:MAG TPA: hydroxysqualene dehydroxylase HpnE [Bacteroidota bacterium]|nr:hydroxysqualene dehydroxylase HpnE [Bacteroidota bacterium]